MASVLYEPEDMIEVANPPLLLFGDPGVGKTSLAQTGEDPLTLDFDGGAHRSAFRRRTLRFESWEDMLAVQHKGIADKLAPNFGTHKEIILDTVGTLLKYLGRSVIAGNAKLGTRAGGLSLQGWGVLKDTFDGWLMDLRRAGKQVVMIAHGKEEKDGDARMIRPDIAGGSYAIVMQAADIVGYMTYRNGQRWIGWDPTDSYFAKNGARLESGGVPSFTAEPRYLAGLLAEAKRNLGKTAEQSAAVAKLVSEWQEKLTLEKTPDVKALNALCTGELAKIEPALKPAVWHLVQAFAVAQGLEFDAKKKVWTVAKAA